MTRHVKTSTVVAAFLLCIARLLVNYELVSQEAQGGEASVVKQVGTAEVRSTAPGTLFDPKHQPEIFWHDRDWNIDLIRGRTGDEPARVSIRSATGSAAIVNLPNDFEQINSILRSLNDKAIVVAEDNAGTGGFAIIDLKEAKLEDKVGVGALFISPSRRFILFKNWYPPHAESYENLYRLYDVMKSARENVCGYRANDPRHLDIDDGMRGFQIFPQRPGQTLCTDPEDDDDDNMATNVVWSPDSSEVAFADVKGTVMSLILVTMPAGAKDLPKTSVYTLKGAQDVCAGATDAAGDVSCDYHVIQSLTWDGDAVKATFHHQFGTKLDLELTIPVSQFIPISK